MLNEKPDPIYLSENIRLLRKQLNLSQEELAGRVGLNRGNIASYEKGTAEPKICNLLKFAQVFKVSILELTRIDLRHHTGIHSVQEKEPTQAVRIPEGFERHISQAEEIRTVVNSLYNCQQFHLKKQENPSKELQAAAMHFEQLHELTQILLEKHERLVRHISGR